MKIKFLIGIISAMCFTGCITPTADINGAEFVQKVEGRKPGEKFLLRRDNQDGYYYADWFVMPPTQSVFKLKQTFRTSTNELTVEQFEAVKMKLADQDAKWPYPH